MARRPVLLLPPLPVTLEGSLCPHPVGSACPVVQDTGSIISEWEAGRCSCAPGWRPPPRAWLPAHPQTWTGPSQVTGDR